MPADHREVTIYRNGFTVPSSVDSAARSRLGQVGDGPFRPLSDPLNKKFMDRIQRKRCQ